MVVDDEPQPIESDLVMLATGFSGRQKLTDIFFSEHFRNKLAGLSLGIPLYRYSLPSLLAFMALLIFLPILCASS